jgi:hypothetical protein
MEINFSTTELASPTTHATPFACQNGSFLRQNLHLPTYAFMLCLHFIIEQSQPTSILVLPMTLWLLLLCLEDIITKTASSYNLQLWPMTSKKRRLCDTGHTMHLYPLNQDVPPQEWRSDCRTISIGSLDVERRTVTPAEERRSSTEWYIN